MYNYCIISKLCVSDIEKIPQDTSSLLQSAMPSSSIAVTDVATNYNQHLEDNSSQSSQQPLTQKMLLR